MVYYPAEEQAKITKLIFNDLVDQGSIVRAVLRFASF